MDKRLKRLNIESNLQRSMVEWMKGWTEQKVEVDNWLTGNKNRIDKRTIEQKVKI